MCHISYCDQHDGHDMIPYLNRMCTAFLYAQYTLKIDKIRPSVPVYHRISIAVLIFSLISVARCQARTPVRLKSGCWPRRRVIRLYHATQRVYAMRTADGKRR